MRIKLSHFLHPLRTVRAVKARILAHWQAATLVRAGKRRFADNPYHDARCAIEGFADRINTADSDTDMLTRIFASYARAVRSTQSSAYDPTDWWKKVRRAALEPVMRSLATGNAAALRLQYANFFRDPCSAGLVSRAFGLALSPQVSSTSPFLMAYLCDVLFRLEYWRERTGGRCDLSELAGPTVGNPFGVVLGGTLVEEGAEYRHYCAQRVAKLLEGSAGAVVEIGGGFGGMAYYLLRDLPGTKYVGFDLPESIAVTAWYLSQALPNRTIVLFGERPLTTETLAAADVVLMPLSELPKLPAKGVDVAFSSHALSDVKEPALQTYLGDVVRTTRRSFLCIGSIRSARLLVDSAAHNANGLELAEMMTSSWGNPLNAKAAFAECLFRVGRS